MRIVLLFIAGAHCILTVLLIKKTCYVLQRSIRGASKGERKREEKIDFKTITFTFIHLAELFLSIRERAHLLKGSHFKSAFFISSVSSGEEVPATTQNHFLPLLSAVFI